LLVTPLLALAAGWIAAYIAQLVPACSADASGRRIVRLLASPDRDHLVGLSLASVALTGTYLSRGSVSALPVTSAYLVVPIAVALIDFRYRLVYPLLALAGVLLALLLHTPVGPLGAAFSVKAAVAGIALFAILYWLGRLLFRVAALGSGDILVAGLVGSVVGFEALATALYCGVLLGGVVAGWRLIRGRARGQASRGGHVPLGAYLCVGAILVLATG
jgi:leader peptidase (prepilin peptidase)/N-methyltransferase